MDSMRWVFNFANWKPTRSEWLFAGRCIQHEEKARISRFVFCKDAKSAIAGRLMLRKLIHDATGINYTDVRFDRTEKGKPFLINPLPSSVPASFGFNLSHQGSYVVLAAEPHREIGVDVMKVEYQGGKSVPEFFRTMKRQFTNHEWDNILKPVDENQQLKRFYRFWCLKESYVKAVGIGIGFNLQRLSFHVKQDDIKPQIIISDTILFIDDKKANDWTFEETMIDDDHCVAVALGKSESGDVNCNSIPNKFKSLTYNDLISNACSWQPEDDSFWIDFSQKDEKPK